MVGTQADVNMAVSRVISIQIAESTLTLVPHCFAVKAKGRYAAIYHPSTKTQYKMQRDRRVTLKRFIKKIPQCVHYNLSAVMRVHLSYFYPLHISLKYVFPVAFPTCLKCITKNNISSHEFTNTIQNATKTSDPIREGHKNNHWCRY